MLGDFELPECPICLNPLASMPVACLIRNNGTRACRHMLHSCCARDLFAVGQRGRVCPLCRTRFDNVRDVPSLRTCPDAWFDTIDGCGRGRLSKREAIDALTAMLNLDPEALESFVDQRWVLWDRAGNGAVTKDDFLRERGGMLASILPVLGQLSFEERATPDIHEGDGLGWFYHYAGPKGYMTKKEFVRAVMRSFDVQAADDIETLKSVISDFWFPACADDKLTEKEFLKENGVQATLKANLPKKESRPTFLLEFAPDNLGLRVRSGSIMSSILIGGESSNEACAQNPPARGNTWELSFVSSGGPYEICFVGGSNPYHGVCTISIDGKRVGEIDQYDRYTVFPTRLTLRWEGAPPGLHVLCGRVDTKNPHSRDYFLCLQKIIFTPIAESRTAGQPDVSLPVKPALTEPSKCSPRCDGGDWELELEDGSWMPFSVPGVSLAGEIGEPIPFNIGSWEYIAILDSSSTGTQTSLDTMQTWRLRRRGGQ